MDAKLCRTRVLAVLRAGMACAVGAVTAAATICAVLIVLWFVPGTPCNTVMKQTVRAMAEGEESFGRHLAEPGPEFEAEQAACAVWEDATALAAGVIAGSLVSVSLAHGAMAASVLGGLLPGILFMLLVWPNVDPWPGAGRTTLIGVIAWAISLGCVRIYRLRKARARTVVATG